jgi:putative membrane protein
MVFVNPLAVMLLSLGSSAFLLALYFYYTLKGKKTDSIIVPSFVLGVFDFISGFFMTFMWPFTTPYISYNILFGDPILFLGLLMIIGSYMLYKKMSLSALSYIGIFFGIYLFVGAYAIYSYNLEPGTHFLPSFGLYFLSGVAAVLAPIINISPKKNKNLYYLEFIVIILVMLIALFLAYTAIYEHIGSYLPT